MTVTTAPPPVPQAAPVPPAPLTPATPPAPTGTTRRLRPGRVLRWVLVGVALVLLVRFARQGWPEIRGSLALLTAEHAPFVALAVLAEALWLLAMSQVYRSALLAFGGRLTRGAALRISMAAFTLSRLLPGGGAAGGAVAARELIALGNPGMRTVASMLASWWITMTGLSAIVFTGIAWSTAAGHLPPGYVAAPAVALGGFVLGGAAIVLATRSPRLRARLTALVARTVDRMGPAVSDRAEGRAEGESSGPVGSGVSVTGLVAVLGWGLVVWTFDAAALWFSLAAFGWHTDIGVLLVGYGVANLISALPELTPGWLGVLEASVAATLAALGVPVGIAVVAVLVYRLASYWLPTLVGIPAAISVVGRPTGALVTGQAGGATP